MDATKPLGFVPSVLTASLGSRVTRLVVLGVLLTVIGIVGNVCVNQVG